MKKDLALYILMRNDLASMNAGRCMAQSSHASNAFIHKFGKNPLVKEWQKQTDQGFGTAIVLSADEYQMGLTRSRLQDANFKIHDYLVDPEYSYIVQEEFIHLIDPSKHVLEPIRKDDGTWIAWRKEMTCFYAFGDRSDPVFKEQFSGLKLF
jgi:hypothetical protein